MCQYFIFFQHLTLMCSYLLAYTLLDTQNIKAASSVSSLILIYWLLQMLIALRSANS